MSHPLLYPVAVIAVAALVTWLTRALPFLAFGKRALSPMMTYLGRVLPPAIMMVLVVYCLRSTAFFAAPYGLPELLACLAVLLLQVFKKNMYLSIVGGTLCYMLLIRLF